MKQALALGLLIALAGSLSAEAQTSQGTRKSTAKSTTKSTARKAAGPSVAQQLTEMREAIAAQQQQISALGQQVQSRDQRIQQLEQKLDQSQVAATQAQAKADAAASQTAEQAQTVTALDTKVKDIETNSNNVALTIQETQKNVQEQIQSPLAIHYKGVTITPGGFAAAETVWRNRGLGADINTPFNSINMPGAGQNAVSEFFGSGRQSRVSMLVEGKAKDLKMSGYYEADFLSAGITSNNNESNSYTLRQRQVWAQAAAEGWSLTGGQMWSLVTETRKGLDNRSEALPMTIDPQYTVGFSWARQYGVRVVKNLGNRFWVGASLENPQTTFAARGNAANFALGSAGSGGGLYNGGITNCSTSTITGTGGTITTVSTSCTPAATYSFNAMPDFIFKAAAEPGFGHYEVFGILSRFRDRVYPCGEPGAASNCNGAISSLGSYNSSVNAGGFGANARITLFKQLDLGVHAVTGQGIGRYGTGGLPDSTVRPDGTLAPLRSYQGLATVEWHTKRIDLYINAGEEYVARRWQFDPNNPTNPFTPVGYGSQLFTVSGCYTETAPPLTGTNGFTFGSLSKCNADTKSLVEGTIGFWIKAHNGPHGRLQFGPQYSYVARYAWTGTNGIAFSSPHGVENMFFTSFRYYLP
jgi:hypothetical protein